MEKKSHFIKALLFLLVSLLGAFVWNESLLYSQNNILFNSHWESYKKNFYGSGASAIYSLLSRNLLANNKLVLNRNLGHQILFTRTARTPVKINLDAKIALNGYIDILFNADERSFEGFRISRVLGEKPFYYKADISGKFLQKIEYDKKLFFPDTNSSIELRSFGDEIYFIVNHQLIARQKASFKFGKLGLYTSLQGLEVGKFSLTETNRLPENLSFTRNYSKLIYFFLNTLIFLMFVVILTLLTLKLFNISFFEVLFRTSVLLASLGCLWYSFDYFYYSKIPKTWSFQEFSFENGGGGIIDFERLRYKTFQKWFEAIGGEIPTVHFLEKNSGYYTQEGIRECEIHICRFKSLESILEKQKGSETRIAYIGGSFADFAGIVSVEDSFFDKFGRLMNSAVPGSKVVNFVFSGIIFRNQVEEIHSILERYNPHVIILSVFMDNEDFSAFRQFIKLYINKNIPILYYTPLGEKIENSLPKRAHYFSDDFRGNKKRKKFWKKLNVKQKIYYVDADKSLKQKGLSEKGLVWWDSNHMTVFAQQFVAEDLSGYVMDLLSKRPHDGGL